MKTTVSTVQKMKDNGEKITMLTAYDYSTAKRGTLLRLLAATGATQLEQEDRHHRQDRDGRLDRLTRRELKGLDAAACLLALVKFLDDPPHRIPLDAQPHASSKVGATTYVRRIHSKGSAPAGGAISPTKTTHVVNESLPCSPRLFFGAGTVTKPAAIRTTAVRAGWPARTGTSTSRRPNSGNNRAWWWTAPHGFPVIVHENPAIGGNGSRNDRSVDPRRAQISSSNSGVRWAKVPTAPENLPTRRSSVAALKRAMLRWVSEYQLAILKPKVMGSA